MKVVHLKQEAFPERSELAEKLLAGKPRHIGIAFGNIEDKNDSLAKITFEEGVDYEASEAPNGRVQVKVDENTSVFLTEEFFGSLFEE